jgi:hypothetical protein
MSTVFIIPDRELETTEDGYVIEDVETYEHVVIAFRSSNGVVWKGDMQVLNKYIDDNVRVYAKTNSAQGIYTIGDLRKEIENS